MFSRFFAAFYLCLIAGQIQSAVICNGSCDGSGGTGPVNNIANIIVESQNLVSFELSLFSQESLSITADRVFLSFESDDIAIASSLITGAANVYIHSLTQMDFLNHGTFTELGTLSADDGPLIFDGDVLVQPVTLNGGTLSIFANEVYIFNYASVSAVPVPAAAWLFGSALIGLAGIKRKK